MRNINDVHTQIPASTHSPQVARGCRLLASLTLAALLFGPPALCLLAAAQAPPSEEMKKLQEEIDRLTKEKQKAELERDIAKAEKERRETALPKTEVKAPEGKTTAEGAVMEGTALAYRSAQKITARMAVEIRSAKDPPNKIIVHNDRDLNSLVFYQAFRAHFEYLKNEYKKLIQLEAPLPPITTKFLAPPFAAEAAAGILKSFVDVMALFRTDTEIKGFAVAIEEAAVVADLSHALRTSKTSISVIYPLYYLPPNFSENPVAGSKVISQIADLNNYKAGAAEKIAACTATPPSPLCTVDVKKNIATYKTLNAQVEVLTGSLLKVDEKTGLTPLTLLLRAETLASYVADEKADILYVRVMAAGGSNRITRNLWTSFGSAVLSHRGGSVVTYILFSKDGAIQLSRTFYCLSKYKKLGGHDEEDFVGNDN